MTSQCNRHRRVVPEHVARDSLLREEPVDHSRNYRILIAVEIRGREAWYRDCKVVATRSDSPCGFAIGQHGLLDEQNPSLLGTSTQEVLRSLIHKIPSQMGETDNIEIFVHIILTDFSSTHGEIRA